MKNLTEQQIEIIKNSNADVFDTKVIGELFIKGDPCIYFAVECTSKTSKVTLYTTGYITKNNTVHFSKKSYKSMIKVMGGGMIGTAELHALTRNGLDAYID